MDFQSSRLLRCEKLLELVKVIQSIKFNFLTAISARSLNKKHNCVVLIIVETTDIIFAIDSVPAILAITRDSFIVYISNVFAILGLRSLYFALSGLMQACHYLHYGLAFLLTRIGIKLALADFVKIPILVTQAIITTTLAISIAVSFLFPKKQE